PAGDRVSDRPSEGRGDGETDGVDRAQGSHDDPFCEGYAPLRVTKITCLPVIRRVSMCQRVQDHVRSVGARDQSSVPSESIGPPRGKMSRGRDDDGLGTTGGGGGRESVATRK